MTPKRFKAVCTETGIEFGADDLSFCGNLDCNYELDKWAFSVWFENAMPTKSAELCQSIGLTDVMKKEIFFDDVLFFRDKSFWVVQFSLNDQYSVIRRLNERFEVCEYTKERPFDLRSIKGLKPIIVGNRWMTAAELQARAEAVSNEGVNRK